MNEGSVPAEKTGEKTIFRFSDNLRDPIRRVERVRARGWTQGGPLHRTTTKASGGSQQIVGVLPTFFCARGKCRRRYRYRRRERRDILSPASRRFFLRPREVPTPISISASGAARFSGLLSRRFFQSVDEDFFASLPTPILVLASDNTNIDVGARRGE